MKRLLAALLAASMMPAVAPAASAQQAQAPDPALQTVLAHERRAADRARDTWRNPAETLAFFQVRPGMTVVDFMPSGGWYTRVIAPYLGASGTYVAVNPRVPADATGFMASMRDTATAFPAQAAPWLGSGGAKVVGANVGTVAEDLNGTVDRFLIFREMHNLRRANWLHDTMLAARKMLKSGGMIGIVQHRAKADAPTDYVLGDNGYQREEDVIALLSAYGFDLVGKSEINANPKDPANWEGGVWTLPPGYRGAPETDTARRAELDAIGESDRMTLLFRKRD
jgi:predicted methyltransferase